MSKSKAFKGKPTQWAMIWLFPLIAIGGLFYPILGYLMLGMMVFLISISYFKGRFWCGNLCPRGSFLDIIMAKFTLNRPWPRFFNRKWFRWFVFGIFMSIFISRMVAAWGDWMAVGGIFVSMCIVTSLIAIPLAIITRPRAWCAVCPMGTLQENLGKMGRKAAKAKKNKQKALPEKN
ncbi:MAG: 4Fe-4S binding protein [Spirulinaceae cyanobacterium]